jgi:hypothetical protein
MAESEKISAIHHYLNEEFNPCTIEYRYDFGKMAHIFEIRTTRFCTAIIKNEFLEANSPQAIPAILRKFLLAEHLRECSFPIVVTNSGLTD